MQTLLAMVITHGVALDRLDDLVAEIAVAAQTPTAPVHAPAADALQRRRTMQERRPRMPPKQARQPSVDTAKSASDTMLVASPRHGPVKRPATGQPAKHQKPSQRPRLHAPRDKQSKNGGSAKPAGRKYKAKTKKATAKSPHPALAMGSRVCFVFAECEAHGSVVSGTSVQGLCLPPPTHRDLAVCTGEMLKRAHSLRALAPRLVQRLHG